MESVDGTVVDDVCVGPQVDDRVLPHVPWRDGFNLPPRASYELDPSLPSGIYSVHGIPFVHRGREAAIAVLIPSNTATAFNRIGGRNFYESPPAVQAGDVLSFHRPVQSFGWMFRSVMQCEGFLRWFASANPHPRDTTYLIDSDLEDPDALDGIEVLIVIGRSEYWTRRAREHFDAFVDRGGRALLLCSELMYWQVRIDLARHQLIRYLQDDPHPDPLLHTKQWHEPSLQYPVHPRTGGELRYGGYDVGDDEEFGRKGLRIVSPDSPLVEGCGLAEGDVLRLPDASVWDGAPVRSDGGGIPEVDFGDEQPLHHEVIGYNRGRPPIREFGESATSLWIALRHRQESGTVVHCGTLGWCGPQAAGGNGPDSERIQAIILRMLSVLLEDDWPFSWKHLAKPESTPDHT
ncbi:MAG TPA: N,N-dimethylformamidase beta subunit family domain-containing protein [Solirubrobacterales bacterium]|nr:N,N-dimethylformamidase beta subunit family domain-containing protein [Solirubrobacterales bacterium]